MAQFNLEVAVRLSIIRFYTMMMLISHYCPINIFCDHTDLIRYKYMMQD